MIRLGSHDRRIWVLILVLLLVGVREGYDFWFERGPTFQEVLQSMNDRGIHEPMVYAVSEDNYIIAGRQERTPIRTTVQGVRCDDRGCRYDWSGMFVKGPEDPDLVSWSFGDTKLNRNVNIARGVIYEGDVTEIRITGAKNLQEVRIFSLDADLKVFAAEYETEASMPLHIQALNEEGEILYED